MNFYNIILTPLEEKNILDSKFGELIVDPRTAHITINIDGIYKSKTKELEALVDSLMILKESLLKRYMTLVEKIDELVKYRKKTKDRLNDLLERKEKLYDELIELQVKIEYKIEEFNDFYYSYLSFLYKDLYAIMLPVKENLKKLLFIKYAIEEAKFLLNDWNVQKTFNESRFNYAKS